MHFQVFFPGVMAEDPALLEAIQPGLSARAIWTQVINPPRDLGAAGMAVGWGRDVYQPSHSPQRRLGIGGGYILLWDPTRPPTPDELRMAGRDWVGWEVLLGTSKWLIPTAQDLPQRFALDAAGNPTLVVKDAHRQYWDACSEWFDRVLVSKERVEGPECFRFAVQCLQMTYRLPVELVDEMQLLDPESVLKIVWAAIDGPNVDRAQLTQKKTTAV